MDIGVRVSALRSNSSVAFLAISPTAQPYVQIYLTARPSREAALSSDPPLARFEARPQTGEFAFEFDHAPGRLPAMTFAPVFLFRKLLFEVLDPLEEFAI